MALTTIGALVWQAHDFFTAKNPNYFLFGTSIILIILAIFVGYEGYRALTKNNRKE